MTCPRCGEPLAAGQEYCLECGAQVVGSARRSAGLGSSWSRRSTRRRCRGARRRGRRDRGDRKRAVGGPTIVTAIGGFADDSEAGQRRGAGERLGGRRVAVGEDGWTIALASLPADRGARAALARAERRARRGSPRWACSTRPATRASTLATGSSSPASTRARRRRQRARGRAALRASCDRAAGRALTCVAFRGDR